MTICLYTCINKLDTCINKWSQAGLILRDDEMGRLQVIKRENIPMMSSCCNELVKTYGEAGRSISYISNKDSEFSL